MPTYEYFCSKCKTTFEIKRPFSESNKTAMCQNCHLEAKRVISGFASKTGFYIKGVVKPFKEHTTDGEL